MYSDDFIPKRPQRSVPKVDYKEKEPNHLLDIASPVMSTNVVVEDSNAIVEDEVENPINKKRGRIAKLEPKYKVLFLL